MAGSLGRNAIPDVLARRDRGRRVLVAGVGNVLRGDDGFGPAVIGALETSGDLSPGVRLVELGIGGIGLVHELLDGYDVLVVVDAVDRGGSPGTLYVLEPDVPPAEALSAAERHALATDTHQAVPWRVLVIARALGILPPLVRIVGCQPDQTEELTLALSCSVQRAVPEAVAAVRSLLSGDQPVGAAPPGRNREVDP